MCSAVTSSLPFLRLMLEAKAEATIKKQCDEISKLTHNIGKLEEDAIQQHKEYDQVINERDILGTQLIRRNEELGLLYEKLKIRVSTLRSGEMREIAITNSSKSIVPPRSRSRPRNAWRRSPNFSKKKATEMRLDF